MNKYPKIYSPFERFTEGPNRNKLDHTRWTSQEILLLRHLPWSWTEKVDGTNIRIGWDGHTVAFGGRTDNAQIPATLFQRLSRLFPEELFEQVFKSTEVTLYGEGFGPKIQKGGGLYGQEQDFILFDVQVGRTWLKHEDVMKVASDMGIQALPVLVNCDVRHAMSMVTNGFYSSFGAGDFFAEGLVGRAPEGLLDRQGNRIMVKVKHVDFYQE